MTGKVFLIILFVAACIYDATHVPDACPHAYDTEGMTRMVMGIEETDGTGLIFHKREAGEL